MAKTEMNTCVFVKTDLLLHEYEFKKLREFILNSPTELKMLDEITGIGDDGAFSVIHHPMSEFDRKILFTLCGNKYLFTSVASLRLLLQL